MSTRVTSSYYRLLNWLMKLWQWQEFSAQTRIKDRKKQPHILIILLHQLLTWSLKLSNPGLSHPPKGLNYPLPGQNQPHLRLNNNCQGQCPPYFSSDKQKESWHLQLILCSCNLLTTCCGIYWQIKSKVQYLGILKWRLQSLARCR